MLQSVSGNARATSNTSTSVTILISEADGTTISFAKRSGAQNTGTFYLPPEAPAAQLSVSITDFSSVQTTFPLNGQLISVSLTYDDGSEVNNVQTFSCPALGLVISCDSSASAAA